METNVIRPLSDSARNSMRAGVIVFDMARVVEELVYNSLDAGASKIAVLVGVASGYIKVVDDGYGISRDNLVLLGERYATSKLCDFSGGGAANDTVGYRGEMLASISDISRLEISTKAIGKPNGYRKVIKGSKCVSLGIDDRKDTGTAVVVRDLFYNQPVRRAYIQSSPKKVLHSVKKCVLRIALVYPQVSFSAYDIESDDELLQINSLSTAFSLLMIDFGIEDASFLHKVNAKDGRKRISGYISGPKQSFDGKAPQYVYINSRFVSKSPIHKLLTHMASSFECLGSWKANNANQRGKRCRHQATLAYLLNLICPHSLYEFNFEASKTCVEFKDWEPILTFVENVIESLWRRNLIVESSGEKSSRLSNNEMQGKGINANSAGRGLLGLIQYTRKKFKGENRQTSTELYSPPDQLKSEDGYFRQQGRKRSPIFELNKENVEQIKHKAEKESFNQVDHSQNLLEMAKQKSEEPDPWEFGGVDIMETGLGASSSFSKHGSSKLRSPKVDHNFMNWMVRDALYFDGEPEHENGPQKPVLRDCTSRDKETAQMGAFESTPDVFNIKEKEILFDRSPDILKVKERMKGSFACYPRRWEECEEYLAHDRSRVFADVKMAPNFRSPRTSDEEIFLSHKRACGEEYFDSAMAMGNINLSDSLSNPTWWFPSRGPVPRVADWEYGKSVHNSICGGTLRLHNRFDHNYSADDKENGAICANDIASKRLSKEKCNSGRFNDFFGLKYNSDMCGDLSRYLQDDSLYDKFSEKNSAFLTDEMGQITRHMDHMGRDLRNVLGYVDSEQNCVRKDRPRRSHSAPPFYREGKNDCFWRELEKSDTNPSRNVAISKVVTDSKRFNQSSDVSGACLNPTFIEGVSEVKKNTKSELDLSSDMKPAKHLRSSHSWLQENVAAEGCISEDIKFPLHSMCKWRTHCPLDTSSKQSCDVQNQDAVLDISLEILQNLGEEYLVPENLNRNCLEAAKVLQQVDKKFIPVVARGILAIVDQHAADERIRLEELRRKVLAGEGRTISYLDMEQELILPEIGFQLLENYSEQIKSWGWICSGQFQGSMPFKRNMGILQRQTKLATLHAVPCILGVNLTDTDLLEFLQQLADTDGSSTVPPSVLRVLNCKACRGAIMFGDTLLPSECSLVVEELKKTSLCLQCAHGRPTTVPLVNLEALHAQIAKLNCSKLWHEQYRHPVSLDRARKRLQAAKM